MKIKRITGDNRMFDIILPCCQEFIDELKDYDVWEIYDENTIFCTNDTTSFMGRYCPFCGQKIIITVS